MSGISHKGNVRSDRTPPLQIERAKKKGLALEVAQHQKKLKQCEAELREMDMIEACRTDELREPEVNFDVEA